MRTTLVATCLVLAHAFSRPTFRRHGGRRNLAARSASDGGAAAPLTFFTADMCPYAQRCWIALEELGVPYERVPIDLRDKPQWFLDDVNPRGKVPAVRDAASGLVVFESHVVNEFLVERFGAERAAGAALMPPAALDRARVRLWNEHLDSQLAPAHFTLLMNKNATDEPAKRAALDAALQHYEDHLVGPYLCGDAFTLADVAALPFFERLTFSLRHFKQYDAIDARRFPRTAAWLERAFARPSFVTTKRPEESLVELYETFLRVDYSFGGLNRNS